MSFVFKPLLRSPLAGTFFFSLFFYIPNLSLPFSFPGRFGLGPAPSLDRNGNPPPLPGRPVVFRRRSERGSPTFGFLPPLGHVASFSRDAIEALSELCQVIGLGPGP